jgi:hypothetical protein
VSEKPDQLPMFDVACKDLRTAIKDVAVTVSNLHASPIFQMEELYQGQHDEMHANITLSYRHLEDAAMRLGKSIQAYDQGKSVYDR